MVKVQTQTKFTKSNGRVFDGFYMDGYLKENIDNFLIKAVEKKFDGVVIVSGIEGAGKTTLAATIAKHCDPTFPGPLLNDGTTRRRCDRMVFDTKQILEQIDKSTVGQAIVIDEAVLSMFSQDHANDMHKILLKKFVTIRKKRLYIFLVIPSIFLLRRYFAIFRTRAAIHCTVNEGINRGFFAFFSYNTKRLLYLRGLKEFNQSAVKPDFRGRFTDTEGFFFDVNEYDKKKEEAILSLTDGKKKDLTKQTLNNTQMKVRLGRDLLLVYMYNYLKDLKPEGEKFSIIDFYKMVKENISLGIPCKGTLGNTWKRVENYKKHKKMCNKLDECEIKFIEYSKDHPECFLPTIEGS